MNTANKIYAPSHIKEYVKPIQGKNKFFSETIDSEFTFAYEVNCTCGNKELIVYKNCEPKVTAYCESCGRTITIYDLIEYPCAVFLENREEYSLEKVTNENCDRFNIAIIFEYSDEFALDDKEFDENDVTGCQIYLYDNVYTQSIMLVDDETA